MEHMVKFAVCLLTTNTISFSATEVQWNAHTKELSVDASVDLQNNCLNSIHFTLHLDSHMWMFSLWLAIMVFPILPAF